MIHFQKKKNKGAIALTSMIVLGSVITLIIISIVLLGLSSRFNVANTASHEMTFMKTDGCLEEALIRLNRDNDYTGGTYTLDDYNCSVLIDGTSLEINASEGDFHQHFLAELSLSPFAIIDFSY